MGASLKALEGIRRDRLFTPPPPLSSLFRYTSAQAKGTFRLQDELYRPVCQAHSPQQPPSQPNSSASAADNARHSADTNHTNGVVKREAATTEKTGAEKKEPEPVKPTVGAGKTEGSEGNSSEKSEKKGSAEKQVTSTTSSSTAKGESRSDRGGNAEPSTKRDGSNKDSKKEGHSLSSSSCKSVTTDSGKREMKDNKDKMENGVVVKKERELEKPRSVGEGGGVSRKDSKTISSSPASGDLKDPASSKLHSQHKNGTGKRDREVCLCVCVCV